MLNDTLLALQSVIKDLHYKGDTDSPFEIVHWKKRDAIQSSADLLSFIGQSSGMEVETVGMGEFFHDLIQVNNLNDAEAEAKGTVEQYRHLLGVLNEHLTDLRVFKVGEGEIDIYVVGRTAEGDWAGIMTNTVET